MQDLLASSTGLVLLDSAFLFLVNYLVYHTLSHRAVSWWRLGLVTLVSAVLVTYLPNGLRFLVNPLLLAVLSYQAAPKLSKRHHIFYGFYAWGVTDLILRTLCLFIAPLIIGIPPYEVQSHAGYLLVCMLCVYPIYRFIHGYMGFEYLKNQESWLLEERLLFHITWLTRAAFCYGLLMDLLVYVTFLGSSDLIYNYLKLIVFLSVSVFFCTISYANRWIKDRSFDALQEEQERHFQSLRESSQHILQLYQDLSRQGVPNPDKLLEEKARAKGRKDSDCLVLTEEELMFTKELPDLTNVYSQLLRSMIESWYMAAKAEGIDFVLEVPEQVGTGSVKVVDLTLVLQAFLAEAFQVARELPEGLVRLFMVQDDKHHVFVVETLSQDEGGVNLFSEALELALSESEDESQLEEVLKRYPQAKVSTKRDRTLFSQVFEY